MKGLWLPNAPAGYGWFSVAPDAGAPAPAKPKGKLGFDPARIVASSKAKGNK